MVYVVHIEFDPLTPGECIAPMHQSQASHTRLDLELAFHEIVIDFQVLDGIRARSHNAHVTFEYIQELWDLIQGIVAKKPPHSGKPGILIAHKERAIRIAYDRGVV